MKTQKETVRLLCKSVINRLENDKAITFNASLRHKVVEELWLLLKPVIYSDEDLKDLALQAIGQKIEKLEELSASQVEQYQAALNVVKQKFGSELLSGLYLQKSPKSISEMIINFLLVSPTIEDVFESDEVLQKNILNILKYFKP